MPNSVARSAADLQDVLDQSKVGFEVARVPAAAAADQWSLIDGALQHRSRGFFSVNGVRFASGDERVLLYQPQGAVTGLLSARIGGELCFLLQARAEPGCLGEAQFGPTVQSTPANFMRMHGGASTPYIEPFIAHAANVSIRDDTTQLDLGERYFFKSKRSILVETFEPGEPQTGFVWTSPAAIRDALLRDAFFNIDLRSILSISDWSALSPQNSSVTQSLRAPPRSDVLGALVHALNATPREEGRFIPLEATPNWQADEWGWREERARQGFAIEFYEVKAALREKASWVQPLVNSTGEGHAVLACRERGGVLEVLVQVLNESGLASGAALAPSHLSYPGSAARTPNWLAPSKIWSATIESDEGGRFYRDTSRYEVRRIDDWSGETHGFWLTLSELKLFLSTSNLCTIQLRGVISQLLGVR